MGELKPFGEDQLVSYADHIKAWMPLIFEFRKNMFYTSLLEQNYVFFDEDDNPTGQIVLKDLKEFEVYFSIHHKILSTVSMRSYQLVHVT